MTRGVGLVLTGVAIGCGGAFLLTRVLSHSLFQVSPTDPLTFAAIATAFVLVAVAATLIPARRAARIDPMVALRLR